MDLVAAADKEQAEVPITPLWRLGLELLALLGGLVGAVLCMPDDPLPFPARNCAYASLVLSLAGGLYSDAPLHPSRCRCHTLLPVFANSTVPRPLHREIQ